MNIYGKYTLIDMKTWNRAEIWNTFAHCAYYITVELDVTRLVKICKDNNIKPYAALNYATALVANNNECFRYGVVEQNVVTFDTVHPIFTVRRENNLFSHKVIEFTRDFDLFYKKFIDGKAEAEVCGRLYCEPAPLNSLCTSITPTLAFKNISFCGEFSTKLADEGLSPFTTFGKYFESGHKLLIPIAVEFRHEVNDGYHAELFFSQLQKEFDEFDKNLNLKF